MKCPRGCGEMLAGELLWVCGWCGASSPRQSRSPAPLPCMVEIPAGKFIMGSDPDDRDAFDHERPAITIYLSTFWISIHPVTNDQYGQFVRETGKPASSHWEARPPVGENGKHPVCFVTWHDAVEYCIWLSRLTGDIYTLPTEAQWEKAARGGLWLDGDERATVQNPLQHRRFPAGRELSIDAANFGGRQGGTTPVGSYPLGASPYGCLDMVGNVSEWCLDTYHPAFYGTTPPIDPYRDGEGKKAVRGGSWRSERDHARCSNRYFYSPDRSSYGIGFRAVRSGS